MQGFSPRPNIKALETWIIGYLKRINNGVTRRQEAKFMEKSLMLINSIFGLPCCDTPATGTTFITPNDNQLTNTIRNLIINGNVIRRFYRKSLIRIRTIINKHLYNCCTEDVTLTFDNASGSTVVQFQLFDPITGEILFVSSPTGDTQIISVPTWYFGIASLLKVCLNVSVSPDTSFILSDSSGVLVTAISSGLFCSSIVQPLQSSYTITGS